MDKSITVLIAILTASLEINMLEYFGLHLLGFLENNLTKGSQKLHPGDIFCEFEQGSHFFLCPLYFVNSNPVKKGNEINPSDNKLETVHYLNPTCTMWPITLLLRKVRS